MSNLRRILVITIVLLVFYIAFSFVPYLSHVAYDFKPDSGNFKLPAKEEIARTYEVNIRYDPVPEKIRNSRIDCVKSGEIPITHRKSKILCQNIYQTDGNDLENKIAKNSPERIALYGQYAIVNYPARTKAQIDNYAGQMYVTARFLDNYLYPKMTESLEVSAPSRRLYVHLVDTDEEIKKFCLQAASACALADGTIYLSIHEKSKGLYSLSGLDRSVKMGYKAGKNEEITYWYHEIQPPNCPMLPKFAHEFTHYFDNLAYGAAETWLEEGVARIFELAIYREMCPPGVKAFDVRREENGTSYPVENFDYPSDEAMKFFLKDFWNGDECKLAQFLLINQELKKQGLKFHRKISQAFKNNNEKERIASLINASSDPESNRAFFQTSGCYR